MPERAGFNHLDDSAQCGAEMWRPVGEHELHLYVDGRLDPSRLTAVATYLEANPRETERICEYCRQNALLRSLGEEIAAALPPAGEARLRRIVAAHRRARIRCAAAATAILLLMGGGAAADIMLRGAQDNTQAASDAPRLPVTAPP